MNPSTPKTTSTPKAAPHSPCTLAVADCRLAAIAAIAEQSAFVAAAYVQQAKADLKRAQDAAADDIKDRKQVATAKRWVEAAEAAAKSTNR